MTWQRTTFRFIALGMMFSNIGACSGSQVVQNASPQTSKQMDIISQIFADPHRFNLKSVNIKGVFQGWRGPCRSGPPVSRSDWMITGTSGCLYVNGPVPAGLNPAEPFGEKITVTGVIRLKMGMPYLELKQ
jgi:hypothetical protein